MRKKRAVLLHRLLWATMLSVLVLFAAYISVGRYYIELVDDYQQQLVDKFVTYTGLPVSVENLYGEWSKLSPIITMETVVLTLPDGSAERVLAIDHLRFQLDTIDSLLNQSIHIKRLFIDNAQVSLVEYAPGKWQLEGYGTDESKTPSDIDLDNLIELFLTVEGAELHGADFKLRYENGEQSSFAINELSLRRGDDFRRIRFDAKVDESAKPLIAIIESDGDPRDQDAFSAQAYIKLDQLDFKSKLPALRGFGIELDDASINSELWLNWQPNTKIALQGHIEIPEIDIAALSGEALAPLKHFNMQFRIEKSAQGWKGWVPHLTTQWQQQVFAFENIQLNSADQELTIALPSVDVKQRIGQLLALDVLSGELTEVFSTLAPHGILENVRVKLSRQKNDEAAETKVTTAVPNIALQANLMDVGLAAWHGAPGAANVSGYFEAEVAKNSIGGFVEVDSNSLLLDFPQVYHQPLEFLAAKGKVKWQFANDRVVVDSGPLHVETDHGPVVGLLDLDLPVHAGAESPPAMDLAIGFRNVPVSYRDRYIPYILNDNLRHWLSVGIQDGQVLDGGFIYRGSLRLGDAEKRSIQLYFNVDDGALKFHDDWPGLTGIDGLVAIDNVNVDVNTTRANMFGLDIAAAEADVRSLPDGGMWLSVNTSASGAASDALRIVNESSINDWVGGIFSNWELEGNITAELQLGIPLDAAEVQPDVDIKVKLADSTLLIPEYRVEFEKLSGPLHYHSEKGIASDGIQAQLLGKPVKAKVRQRAEKAVVVDIESSVAMQDVQAWSQRPSLALSSGVAAVTAQIVVAPDSEESVFTVNSDLKGVAIDLPAPYGKTAVEELPFWLTFPLGQPSALMRMGLAELLELQLLMTSEGAESGLVIVAETQDFIHEKGSISLVGELDYFNYDEWSPVLADYVEADKLMASARQEKPDQPTEATLTFEVRDVMVRNFSGFDQEYKDSIVKVAKQVDGWWISAVNDVLAGSILIANDSSAPLVVSLQRFNLHSADGDGAGLQFEDFTGLNMNLSIKRLSINDEQYGSLAFDFRGSEQRVLMQNIVADIRGVKISDESPAILEWKLSDDGQSSRFYGQLQFADLGDTFEAWNYERIIETRNGSASVDLAWDDSPEKWALVDSEGTISLRFRDGQFLKASDTAAGTLKVVGIVNLSNIIRRLQLDFSDVSNDGITFTRIEGEAAFKDSTLSFIEDLVITSPSSGFTLRGNADLLAEQLDMDLTVTLPLANNLPWIAALAGGLPTAAGVYVASKIFEKQVDRFSSAMYTVKGDWNNPELNFKRVFSDGKSSKGAGNKPVSEKASPVVPVQ